MIICLDPGHLGKPTHPHDRGASWRGVEEASVATAYLLAADRHLRRLGHEVFLFPGLGSYSERIRRASEAGADVYVQGHADAGLAGHAGDRGTVVHDYRSTRGLALARSVAASLDLALPWDVRAAAGRPDDDGQARDEDYSEAYGCIAPCYALRPVGLLLEPGFLDGLLGAAWLPANPEAIGRAIAEGIDAWARSR